MSNYLPVLQLVMLMVMLTVDEDDDGDDFNVDDNCKKYSFCVIS